MTLENPYVHLRHISSNGGVSIVMLVFGGFTKKKQPHPNSKWRRLHIQITFSWFAKYRLHLPPTQDAGSWQMKVYAGVLFATKHIIFILVVTGILGWVIKHFRYLKWGYLPI